MAEEPSLPWLWGTLLFLLLAGVGRGLLWPFRFRLLAGGDLVVSLALGSILTTLVLLGVGWGGFPEGRLWALALLGGGLLLALPGLYWLVGDLRGAQIWPGKGPLLLRGGLVFLLFASLGLSLWWLFTGLALDSAGLLFGEGRDLLAHGFEGAAADAYPASLLHSAWGHRLGGPGTGLVLTWWLLAAMLLGVCAMGTRLHSHGAGFAAAAMLAFFLFISDHVLFFQYRTFGALALLAVMLLAVEGRGRPNVARSLLAGGIGGFALFASPFAWMLLLPLAIFAPSWCVKAGPRAAEGRGLVPSSEAAESGTGWQVQGGLRYELPDDDQGGASSPADDGEPTGEEGWVKKKWGTPLRHGAIGLGAASLFLVPSCWYDLGEPLDFDFDYVSRGVEYGDAETRFTLLGDAPSTAEDVVAGYERSGERDRIPFGVGFLDDSPMVDRFFCATEWGALPLMMGLVALLPATRRRKHLLYFLPAAAWFGVSSYATGFDGPCLEGMPLFALLGGFAFADYGRLDDELEPPLGCPSVLVELAVVFLALLGLGISVTYQCGYWDFEIVDLATGEPIFEDDRFYHPDSGLPLREQTLLPLLGSDFEQPTYIDPNITGFIPETGTEDEPGDEGIPYDTPSIGGFIPKAEGLYDPDKEIGAALDILVSEDESDSPRTPIETRTNLYGAPRGIGYKLNQNQHLGQKQTGGQPQTGGAKTQPNYGIRIRHQF